jgi:hypothetical protein
MLTYGAAVTLYHRRRLRAPRRRGADLLYTYKILEGTMMPANGGATSLFIDRRPRERPDRNRLAVIVSEPDARRRAVVQSLYASGAS